MKCVLFDLDNTLTHRNDSILTYVDRFLLDFADSLCSSISPMSLYERIVVADNGGYSGHDARCRQIRQLDIWSQAAPTESALFEHWDTWFPSNPSPMPYVVEALEELKNAGFTLGVITNGDSDVQRRKINALGITDYFDSILASEDIGISKPDARVFYAALEQMGCQAEHAVYVGDHPVNDYAGAKAVGMTPIWVRGFMAWPADQEKYRYHADSLREVVDVIFGLNSTVLT
ncbi:HAD-IA family hydrolase [Vibrio sp. S4M6]|uniref:HAD family hydrolase n=1 Tax=Vibrio sinus TaxID=2946865 RepID=UPI002029CFC2|nr:HAD-IA family hydrolase [Vibrio sinus]MCL9783875.1 HAD-IA family hydrolase [Vibrio sinus]